MNKEPQMNNTVKTALKVTAAVVVTVMVGKFVLSSIGTALVIGGVVAVGYYGYKKFKGLKMKSAFEQKVSSGSGPAFKSRYQAPAEGEADFMFSNGNNRKDL